MPPKNESGTEMTRAQGHDTTKNVRPRRIQSDQPPTNSGGTSASTAASPTTMGV